MSRIGKKPVPVPANVKVAIANRNVAIEGPKGKLEYRHRPEVTVEFDEEAKELRVSRNDATRASSAFQGLARSLLANMMIGVTEGYEKKLEIVGVGYVGTIQGNELRLRVGFANEIAKKIPAELDVTCPDNTHVVVRGCCKQKVGQFAAEVRAVRKPEPYKGKGIRYDGEIVKIKPGKAAT